MEAPRSLVVLVVLLVEYGGTGKGIVLICKMEKICLRTYI